jgi:methylphosphotriester-DNA--protein-cysteine methyltransferase
MIRHSKINDKDLRAGIRHKLFLFGGNVKLKIYGKLNCSSGKRMKKENRVFFISEEDARKQGFRPCGHCLHGEYKKWNAVHGPQSTVHSRN